MRNFCRRGVVTGTWENRRDQGSRRRVPALAAALFCAVGLLLAQSADGLFDALRSDDAPGAAVLVVRDGDVLFQHGYGLANLKTREKITAATNFRLASVTKQFTAMAVMLLVHDGKLRYDQRLTDIFPDFPAYGRPIRLRHLLTHTSGLQDYEDIMQQRGWDTGRQIKDAEVLDLLKHADGTKFAAGTRFEYSNSGYAVLAMVVEKVSGQPFGGFLHDRIFAPVGMANTVAYEKGKNEVAHRAYGYTREGQEWRETDQSPTSAVLGDGGIYSSVTDLAKWFGALDRHTLLSAAEMVPAFTPADVPGGPVKVDDVVAGYGFGWAIDQLAGFRRMWHHGETVGFRTNVQRFPDRRLAVIVLQNRTEPNPREAATKLAEMYLQ